MGSMPRPGVDWAEGENGVATWFRSKNQIRNFGPLTYMYRYAYQIMGLEFGYNSEGVRHPRPIDLWASLHYVLLGHIKIKKL